MSEMEYFSLNGLVANGWLELGRGKVISKGDLAANPGTYPVYSSAALNNGKFGAYGDYMFDEELITWSVDGGGNLFYRPKHRFSVTNVGGFIRVLNPERIFCKYLYYALSALHSRLSFDWTLKAHPSVIVRLYTGIFLPPLPEQRRIAAILDKADALRTQRREALAQLDRLSQSIFLEMFGDPVGSATRWPSKRLSECCEAINDCPHSTPEWADEGFICLRTSNLTAGGWNWNDKRFVSEADYHERSRRGHIRAGDIILSREGTVGIAAIVQAGMEVCMGQRLVQVRCAKDLLVPEYLLQHLLYVLAPSRISRLMVGSTAQHLNVKELRALPVPLPPLTEQLRFRACIQKLKALHLKHGQALHAVSGLFASLQDCLLRGEHNKEAMEYLRKVIADQDAEALES